MPINSFNSTNLTGVQVGYTVSVPALNGGGGLANTSNTSNGAGTLTATTTIPQVLGLNPLFPCCSGVSANNCVSFSFQITGNVGGIGWNAYFTDNINNNLHANGNFGVNWTLNQCLSQIITQINGLIPNMPYVASGSISGSIATVQICCPNTKAYNLASLLFTTTANPGASGGTSYISGGTLTKVGAGGGKTAYTSSINLQFITIAQLAPPGCQDCRQGNYAADIIPDDTNFELPVFADPTTTGYLTSDYTPFLLMYPPGYDAINSGDFNLQQYINGSWVTKTTLNTSLLGTPFNNNLGSTKYPFYQQSLIPFGSSSLINYQGFSLDWRLVYNNYGAGTYRFYVSGTNNGQTYCMRSIPYCLSLFTCQGADRTLKFETWTIGGNSGSTTTQGAFWTLDIPVTSGFLSGTTVSMMWKDSIRFYGFTGAQTDDITRDQIKYQTGQITKIRDELIKKYKVWISPMPDWFHKRFAAYGLMADYLFVTDNNYNNRDYTLQFFYVVADSGYDPVHLFESRYARIDGTLLLKEGQQFVFRDRC